MPAARAIVILTALGEGKATDKLDYILYLKAVIVGSLPPADD